MYDVGCAGTVNQGPAFAFRKLGQFQINGQDFPFRGIGIVLGAKVRGICTRCVLPLGIVGKIGIVQICYRICFCLRTYKFVECIRINILDNDSGIKIYTGSSRQIIRSRMNNVTVGLPGLAAAGIVVGKFNRLVRGYRL